MHPLSKVYGDCAPCTPRTEMPQVDEKDLLQLVIFLAEHSVSTEAKVMPVDRLVFHQRVYPNRIPPPASADMHKPLLVAADGYILDGNHRAAAHRRDGTSPVVFKLGLPFHEAIALLFKFPATYRYERA